MMKIGQGAANSLMAVMVLGLAGLGLPAAAAGQYQWESFQVNMNTYLRADTVSIDNQIQLMEQDLRKIQAAGRVPPGYHAHLALLYKKQGKPEQAEQNLMAEKRLYPESGPVMDAMLRNIKK